MVESVVERVILALTLYLRCDSISSCQLDTWPFWRVCGNKTRRCGVVLASSHHPVDVMALVAADLVLWNDSTVWSVEVGRELWSCRTVLQRKWCEVARWAL
jgi:hypothetical protein